MGNKPLVDLALEKVVALVGTGPERVAVNVHHGREQMEEHLSARSVHVSVEEPVALGTAGAVAHLRPWLDGRDVLLTNADAWYTASLAALIEGWQGSRPRVMVAGDGSGGLSARSRIVASLLAWTDVLTLAEEPSGLYEAIWRPAEAGGRLEVVGHEGPFWDCGHPANYLAANMASSGGASVVGEGALVEGRLESSVVWPGSVVHRGERLVDAIRALDLTVLIRPVPRQSGAGHEPATMAR